MSEYNPQPQMQGYMPPPPHHNSKGSGRGYGLIIASVVVLLIILIVIIFMVMSSEPTYEAAPVVVVPLPPVDSGSADSGSAAPEPDKKEAPTETSLMNEIWGLGTTGSLYNRPDNGTGTWALRSNQKFTDVSVGPDYLWGVGTNTVSGGKDVYKCKRPCNGNWVKATGGIVSLDVGKSDVWGINANSNVFHRPADGSSEWIRVGGSLKNIAVGDTSVWGTNSSGLIYRCEKPCKGDWKQVAGNLKQLDIAGGNVYGVDSTNKVWTKPESNAGGWSNINTGLSGGLSNVTSGSTSLWGTDKAGGIWRCAKPCKGDWRKMAGTVAKMSGTA
jgi:hypothetical protein